MSFTTDDRQFSILLGKFFKGSYQLTFHFNKNIYYCSYFREFNPELVRDLDKQSTWPVQDTDDTEQDGVRLKQLELPEDIEFVRGKGVSLEYKCGDTACKFKIKCYHYVYQGTDQ